MPQEEAPGDRRELAAFPASAVAQPLARMLYNLRTCLRTKDINAQLCVLRQSLRLAEALG